MEVILASASPRRKQLLGNLGFDRFTVWSPDVDEKTQEGLSPWQLVETLSARKAAAVAKQAGSEPLIIAADTVVDLEGRVLGKPAHEAEAFAMLSALSGRRHTVYTGVTARRGEQICTQHEATQVSFRPLTPEEIRAYIATGEPMDKAGAYGIQEYGSLLVEGVFGDYFNVMGLPINRLRAMLARFGIDCLKLAGERRT